VASEGVTTVSASVRVAGPFAFGIAALMSNSIASAPAVGVAAIGASENARGASENAGGVAASGETSVRLTAGAAAGEDSTSDGTGSGDGAVTTLSATRGSGGADFGGS
jgi:hypothetical protein